VWDVHEDTAAAVTLKPWLPSSLRRASAVAVSAVERLAERRVHLLLAEHAYAHRFRQPHVVVPNTVAVPDRVMAPERPRAVYVGHLSAARGAAELVGVAQRLHDQTAGKLRTVLIGNADEAAQALIRPAVARGVLDWLGYLPSGEALAHLDGAVAGLSLLHDQPNYRVSMPTKVVEYMSRGVPVVTTPLPLAEELVTRTGAGVVVPFADPEAAASTVMRLWGNSDLRHRMGAAGHQAALEEYDWRAHEGRFVAELSRVASAPG
jgi:glycosyltransferase involved in cell wall biosynthesis